MTGQDWVKLTQNKLAGFGNAASPQVILGHLNEGKDEVWALIKSMNEGYFLGSTQFSDNTQTNYFGPLATNAREYNLPADFREMKFIEVVAPSDQNDIEFIYRPITHPSFVEARRAANISNSTNVNSEYVYTIIGSNPQQMMLADYPEQAFQLKIWYVHSLPDIGMGDSIDEIVSPYDRKITDFAAKRVMLANDLMRFEAWKQEWKESLITIMDSAGPRNQADAVFVQDFEG